MSMQRCYRQLIRGATVVTLGAADGLNWTRPNLGLFEVSGSTDNNYVLAHMSPFSHNFSPFLDRRPDCPPEQRFKALAGTHASGLVAFASADGIHWEKMQEESVITSDAFAFDSQNVSFWSEAENRYVIYFRTWQTPHGRLRTITRATSEDFLEWSEPEQVMINMENEHLYTSQAHPYFRAPHLTIALATRFLPERGSTTDIILATSRDGLTFDRVHKPAYIRPAPTRESWSNRGNYAALNVFPLRDNRPGIQAEHWRYTQPIEMGIIVRGRVYRLPLDGFASIHAGYERGEMVTQPIVFEGGALRLNYQTSAAGSIRVEIQDEHGQPVPNYTLADNRADMRGDLRGQRAHWRQGTDVNQLAGQPIRLRFVMRDADLFAIRFTSR